MAPIVPAKRIHSHLVFRSAASTLFDDAAFQSGDVVVDFAGVKFASRSFAQEYLACKSKQRHGVTEINMPEDVKMMFEIVGRPRRKVPPLRRTEPIVMKV